MRVMKRVIVAGLIGVVLPAMAGYKVLNRVVSINPTNRSAQGEMSGARNSADSTQWIGCGATRLPGNSGFGFCQATDASGRYIFAYTTDVGLIEHLSKIPSDAFVDFSWDANGMLTSVTVDTSFLSRAETLRCGSSIGSRTDSPACSAPPARSQ